MILYNIFSNRYKLGKIIGECKSMMTGTYIELNEEKMTWNVLPDYRWLYRENPIISTIEDVENLIKSKERIKKLKSL
ncbi:hypothetical protein M0Q50_05160 [bacterium]|jgi:hypothetical protein|nr:hypothetical protein [bacterium]